MVSITIATKFWPLNEQDQKVKSANRNEVWIQSGDYFWLAVAPAESVTISWPSYGSSKYCWMQKCCVHVHKEQARLEVDNMIHLTRVDSMRVDTPNQGSSSGVYPQLWNLLVASVDKEEEDQRSNHWCTCMGMGAMGGGPLLKHTVLAWTHKQNRSTSPSVKVMNASLQRAHFMVSSVPVDSVHRNWFCLAKGLCFEGN